MGIIDNIKDAVKLVQQVDNVELYRKILDLQSEAMDLVDQMKKKDETIETLKVALELKGRLLLRHSAYYLADESDKLLDGPFCTKCFDVDHVKCRLVRTDGGMVQCQKCKSPFRIAGPVIFRFGESE